MKKTIADYPELAKEWHPTLNGDLMPCNVSYSSHEKIWWKCEKGHNFEARVSNRSFNESNCPFCSNKFACKDNCLATTHPELAKEWHPTKNGSITPNDILAGTDKKYWWICQKSHDWLAACDSRSGRDNGCPYCANQKVCKDNCLATTHPEIAKEWHPIKNGNITPNDVLAGTHKKYWWICQKSHEWKSHCANRTTLNRGCPYCANQKVCKDNCLATTHPEIAKEWHPTKNGNLTPSDIVAGSNKKYWWKCEKGHEWISSCNNRTGKQKRGCSICNESKGEKEVARILEKLNIKYYREFKFNNCKSIKNLPFDFLVRINNKAKIIEYHGIQHYEPCNWGSTRLCKHENLKGIQDRDKIKKDFCESRGMPFLEISYKDYDKIEELITKFVGTKRIVQM